MDSFWVDRRESVLRHAMSDQNDEWRRRRGDSEDRIRAQSLSRLSSTWQANPFKSKDDRINAPLALMQDFYGSGSRSKGRSSSRGSSVSRGSSRSSSMSRGSSRSSSMSRGSSRNRTGSGLLLLGDPRDSSEEPLTSSSSTTKFLTGAGDEDDSSSMPSSVELRELTAARKVSQFVTSFNNTKIRDSSG